ncbi:L-seryl-tRNA(Sec) kinase [Engystomops pustulosus]|uniref:L-seryl-tRNA(Sec) kinase n=1 Tax=Engystomops pustulosus TaxID=76066 RepID=UPI003AFAE838
MDAAAKSSPIGLCVLCGLPGAGKSTLAQRLKERQTSCSIVIISYDDVMGDGAFKEQALLECREVSCQSENQGGRETSPWKRHRQQLLRCLENLITALLAPSALRPPNGKADETWKRLVQCLESQGLVSDGEDSELSSRSINVRSGPVYFILDDNFYYQSMRYEVFQLARKYSLGFCQLYLQCPVDCCLMRNNERQNGVTDRTIILMDSKLERPNPEKNTWEKNSLILDSSNMDDFHGRITSLMNEALENPVMALGDDSEEKEKDRDICAANVIHQADKNLRHLISETMQAVKGLVSAKDIKRIAQELQRVKVTALDQLRHSITVRTGEAAATDIIAAVISHFREEVDCILQQFLPKVQSDSHTAPPSVS